LTAGAAPLNQAIPRYRDVHLRAAIEFGCDVFLTNDNQLANFPDITVEELP
jgi:hypothetical protein